MAYREVKADLTKAEQDNVRLALRYLHAQLKTWEAVARALHFAHPTVVNVMSGDTASVVMAFRISRLVKVPLEDLIGGKYAPKGMCSNCGFVKPKKAS